MRPIIISVAITGSVPRKKDNPALPVLPAEQIESTQVAYEAGATLVHIHVRNDDESPSSDPDRFAEVQAGVRKHCPGMIVQFSTGGRGRDPAARGLSLVHQPDMASLSTGSTNFPTIVYENPAALVLDLATRMKQFEIAPEIEIFDLSHIHGAKRLIDAGFMSPRPHVQRAARRRTSARYSAFGNQARHSRRDLDRGRYRSPSIAGLGMGLAAWRECGAYGHGGQHSDQQGSPRIRQRRARKHRGRFDPKAWLQAGDSGRGADRAWPSRGPVIGGLLRVERRDSRNVTSDLIGSGSFQRSRLMKTAA
jgi:hypothetical protein